MITVNEACCYILRANRKTSIDHAVLCKHLEDTELYPQNSQRDKDKMTVY